MRLLAFFKREAVLTVAALCALATMVLVPPDAAYLGYIDLRVLCLLLCLMAVVAGFQSCGAFQWLAGHLLSRGTGPRALAVILVLLILAVISYLRRRPKRYRGGQSYRTRHRNRSYHGRRR